MIKYKKLIIKKIMQFFIIILLLFSTLINAKSTGESTGFKLPRFVSTKFDESNLRIGAGKDYPIKLTYIVKNFPLEIIDEHELWRKIIDINGNHGWMKGSLLKGNRYGIIKTSHNSPAQIYNKPRGKIVGKIENRNIVKLNKCFDQWCHIKFNKYKGWINKINVWGVYAEEQFNMPFYHFFLKLSWKFF